MCSVILSWSEGRDKNQRAATPTPLSAPAWLQAALFRRPIPKRALAAAVLGALYSFFLIPIPGAYTFFGVNLAGVAWLLMSIGLLFLRPLSYYAYVTWGLLWVVWKGVVAWQARSWIMVLDVVIPAVGVLLLTASGYLDAAHEAKAEDEGLSP